MPAFVVMFIASGVMVFATQFTEETRRAHVQDHAEWGFEEKAHFRVVCKLCKKEMHRCDKYFGRKTVTEGICGSCAVTQDD